VFVPSGYIGQPPSWVTDGRYDLSRERVMRADELRALPPALVRIGSHTVAHANLPQLPAAEMERELSDSRGALEAILDRGVRTLSFPFGAYSASVIEACRRAGYERVYTTEPRASCADGFVVDRVAVEPTDWSLELRVKALGGYGWMTHYSRLKQRVRTRGGVTATEHPA
jgi:peptidoglycan/xylan/chitin deacetylase (PgdA/CDA1 family)